MSQQPFTEIALPKRAQYGVLLVNARMEVRCQHCTGDKVANYDVDRCCICGALTCTECMSKEFYVCSSCFALPHELQDAVKAFRKAMEDARVLETKEQ